jgi:hypothetical protein
MAFTYASGTYQTVEGKPASAFTRGDLLTLTSGSSLSRINELMVSGNDIIGVALANSSQSVNNLVPVLVPNPDTTFWASFHTATTSLVTMGLELDVSYGLPNGGQYVTTSATSARVVIVRGNGGDQAVDQSIESRVLVRLISNAGNLEIS